MNPRRVLSILLAVLALAGVIGWHLPYKSQKLFTAIAKTATAIPGPIALSGPTMGSTWTVRIVRTPAPLSPEQIQSDVQAVLDRVESQMSTYRSDSDLSRFNRFRGTEWVSIPLDFARVANEARHVSEQTGGAFDVTVGALVNLWGFGPDHPAGPFGTLPSDPMIETARRHVGYRLLDVRLSPPALRKADALMYVDLSAIAKGYAAELVGRRLEELGVDDYLVLVGGEVRARGLSHLGRPWHVGIENPTPGVRRVLYTVALKDLSLSTSGDYRNYFDVAGKRYCHEIDPATGRPSTRTPASVSVAHASAAYADAMATALMVLGPDEGLALARKLNLAAFFIIRGDGHFETRATPQFPELLSGD